MNGYNISGFVFYEADCFGQLRNPYIPVTAEDATLAQLRQKLLSGPGLDERREVCLENREVMMIMMMMIVTRMIMMMMIRR